MAKKMSKLNELNEWLRKEKKNGLVDFKCDVITFEEYEEFLKRPLTVEEKNILLERSASAILEVLKNKSNCENINTIL